MSLAVLLMRALKEKWGFVVHALKFPGEIRWVFESEPANQWCYRGQLGKVRLRYTTIRANEIDVRPWKWRLTNVKLNSLQAIWKLYLWFGLSLSKIAKIQHFVSVAMIQEPNMSAAMCKNEGRAKDAPLASHFAGCSPKRKNATTWKLRQHTGTVLECSELREHTEPPIDSTRLKHLEKLFSNVLNWIELNWIATYTNRTYSVKCNRTFSLQLECNRFVAAATKPGNQRRRFQDLGRCFQNWIAYLKSCIRGCMLTTRLHEPIPCIL